MVPFWGTFTYIRAAGAHHLVPLLLRKQARARYYCCYIGKALHLYLLCYRGPRGRRPLGYTARKIIFYWALKAHKI